MRHKTKHLKQLTIGGVQIRKHQQSLRIVDRLNNAQQNGDADAIDQLSLLEVDHDAPHPARKKVLTLALDTFSPELIEVGAGINHRRVLDKPGSDLSSTHSVPPD